MPHLGDGWELGEGVEEADDFGGLLVAQDKEAFGKGKDVITGERVEFDIDADSGDVAEAAA